MSYDYRYLLARYEGRQVRVVEANEVDRFVARLKEAIKASDQALSEAREMLGVFEDHGGHDGLGGKGYLATISHMDEARKRAAEFLRPRGLAST